MAKVENLKTPQGWLIDPHNKWAIHFSLKNESNDGVDADLTIDMWGVDQEGKPNTFKSRRKASKDDSLKTWKQLISSNWTLLDSRKIKSA